MKMFKVVDPRTGGDVFGGAMPEASLTTVYPLANLPGEKPFTELGVHESALHETITPARGHGVYKVIRVEDENAIA